MSPTLTEKGKSFSFTLGFASLGGGGSGALDIVFSSSGILNSLLLRLGYELQGQMHGSADFFHGGVGTPLGPRRSRLKNIPGEARILLVFFAAFLHGVED